MNFEVTIEDAASLAGITSAREARNATLPDIPNPDYVAGAPDLPETIADIGLTTDAEYVQFVMEKAAESYAKQYPAD
jgi:hypothetical protein